MKRVLALATVAVALVLAGRQSSTPHTKAIDPPTNSKDKTGKGVADVKVDHVASALRHGPADTLVGCHCACTWFASPTSPLGAISSGRSMALRG